MDGFSSVWNNLNWSVLSDALISILSALLCITVHEVSHGLVAYKLGDPTAKAQGRLTLNPIKHIDLFGLLMMIFFRFGWAKPVPVDMRYFKKPKAGMAVTALAGPFSNLILAAALMLLMYPVAYAVTVGGASLKAMIDFLQRTAYLSVSLGVFNLIPIPPLDGSKILFSLLPETLYFKLMRYERFGVILLYLLVWNDIISAPLQKAVYFLYTHMLSGIGAFYGLFS